jgi:ketosteroid isomerase-like protein
MATDAVTVVRDAFADWNEHQDLDRLVEHYYDEAVEFEVAFQGGRDDANFVVLHGTDEARHFWADFMLPFSHGRYEIEELVDLGGGEALALMRAHLRIEGSTAEVAPQPFAYVISVRDGRIVRVRDYPDRAEAWRAVGREPAPAQKSL